MEKPIIENREQLHSIRSQVRTRLLEENILVLMGEIEDYYPDMESGNKIEAALEFSAESYEIGDLQEYFVDLPREGDTDMKVFLEKVFQGS